MRFEFIKEGAEVEPPVEFEIEAGKPLQFLVIAEDEDAFDIYFDMEGIRKNLPHGADFVALDFRIAPTYSEGVLLDQTGCPYPDPVPPYPVPVPPYPRPVPPPNYAYGILKWTPTLDKVGDHTVVFVAYSTSRDGIIVPNVPGENIIPVGVDRKELSVTIVVRPAREPEPEPPAGGPIFSIELNESLWKLEGVKLGERRSNVDSAGHYIHKITNKGNVPVCVDIGYVFPEVSIPEAPKPGLQQGMNTFVTLFDSRVIPPDGRLDVGCLEPGGTTRLPLTFGAPTELMMPCSPITVGYEIRVYSPDRNYVVKSQRLYLRTIFQGQNTGLAYEIQF